MQKFGLILTIGAVLAGCAAPINMTTAQRYSQVGYAARDEGNWPLARQSFSRAVLNAELAGADANTMGMLTYEYGRALGVTCDFAQSESLLLKSKTFAEQAGSVPYLSLYELALLSKARNKPAEELEYLAELAPAVEKVRLEASYPLGVADVYERYAAALAATGNAQLAQTQSARAQAIRAAHPDAKKVGLLTPYGSECGTAVQPPRP